MDDTFEFLQNVGDEYEPPDPDDDRVRCDRCDAFLRDDEGTWDTMGENIYCDRCVREIDRDQLCCGGECCDG